MSREEALESFTEWAAYAAFQEHAKGRISPGFLADMTVLSADPLTLPPEQIPRIRVLRTIVGGVEVYRAEDRAEQRSGS
jgi:hypothetical protein